MSDPPEETPRGLWARLTATKWRVTWGYLAALLLLALSHPTPRSIAFGLPFVLLGEVIRIIANGTLIKDKALTHQGIYAHVRHPLYTGSGLLGVGFLLMASQPLIALGFLILFVTLYRRTVLREEEKMTDFFGAAYAAWARTTPRFLPRRLAPGEIATHFTVRRAWVNREYEGVLGVIGVTAVLYLKYLFLG